MDASGWLAIVTAAAAVSGPLIAVWITRLQDARKDVRDRKMNIFRTLMRTRMLPIHHEHVGALNLIEIDFADDPKVMGAWREYRKNLGEEYPINAAVPIQNDFQSKRDRLLTKLISEIANHLKFKVEQMDIFEGNYIPRGWHDEDTENRLVRRGMADVFSGRRPLMIHTYTPPTAYPPPPVPQPPLAVTSQVEPTAGPFQSAP